MIQELEICVLVLIIIGIMFLLCIDVLKRNNTIKHADKSRNERVVEVIEPVEIMEVVYPMYIDCSRNTHRSLTSN